MADWKIRNNNSSTTVSKLWKNAGPSAFQLQGSMLKSAINCNKLSHNFGPMQTTFGVCVENMVWVTEFNYAENILMGP